MLNRQIVFYCFFRKQFFFFFFLSTLQDIFCSDIFTEIFATSKFFKYLIICMYSGSRVSHSVFFLLYPSTNFSFKSSYLRSQIHNCYKFLAHAACSSYRNISILLTNMSDWNPDEVLTVCKLADVLHS